jgi:hypothetical protein
MDEQQDDGYELFRRAILERDDDAWTAIYTRYRSLLVSWANRCQANARTGEWQDDIADHALARAWAALTPERFAAFHSLPALLAYLRACVATAVIDCARSRAVSERMLQKMEVGAIASPEQIVLAEIDRDELWRLVGAIAETPEERIVLVESFAYGLPPRAILTRHPQIFANIAAVYSVKRNLITRLQRDRELLRLRDEFVPV